METVATSRQRRGPSRVVEAVLAGVCLLVLVWLLYLHARIVIHPFQGEYREGVMLNTTRALLAGRNPFAIANGPQDFNQYGILYNLLATPLAFVFGPSLWVHRAMSAVFVFLSLATLIWTSRKRGCSWPTSLSLAVVLYVSLFTPVAAFGLLARPDSLGLWLMLLSVVIPWHHGYSPRSLALSAGLAVLGYLAKPYFVVGFPLVSAYVFLCVSKRRAMGATLLFVGLAALSVVILDTLLPLYSSATFFSTLNFAGQASRGRAYATQQLATFAKWYAPAVGLGLGWALLGLLDHARSLALRGRRTPAGLRAGWLDLPVDPFLFAFVGASVLIYVKLGGSKGTYMAYLVHLMLPFLLLYLAGSVARAGAPARHLCQLAILANVVLLTAQHGRPVDPDASRTEWARLAEIVGSSERIFNSPVLVSLLVEKNRIVYDSGHSQWFGLGAPRPGVFGWVLAPDTRVSDRDHKYRAELDRAVEARTFDAIVVTDKEHPLLSDALARTHYRETERLRVRMPFAFRQTWQLTVLRPLPPPTSGPTAPGARPATGAGQGDPSDP